MTPNPGIRPTLNLVDWLNRLAAHNGHRPAVEDDLTQVTFSELVSHAHHVASAFNARGIGPGSRVATLMEPSVAQVIVILGAMAAGAAPLPANIRLGARELTEFFGPVEPDLVVTDEVHANLAEAASPGRWVRLPAALTASAMAERLAPLHTVRERLEAVSDDMPGILFGTGGTTGTPKAAAWDHRGLWLWLNTCSRDVGRSAADFELYCSPFFHISFGTGLLSTLFAGGRIRIMRKFDPNAVLAALDTGITRIMAAHTMFEAIRSSPRFQKANRDSLRAIYFGGSISAEGFVRQLLSDYPNAYVYTGYGATEFAPSTWLFHEDILKGHGDTVGRPIPGAVIRIIDDDGTELKPGVPGEVVVNTPWRAVGYWNSPAATAETYTPLGVRSGDVGYLDESGFIHLVGRKKEMIRSGAENIFPSEVEAVFTNHPQVTQAVVYGVPDDYWGERVEMAVVPASKGRPPTLEELKHFAAGQLAGYKMPKILRVVDEIPLTPAFKPDRRTLRDRAAAGASNGTANKG